MNDDTAVLVVGAGYLGQKVSQLSAALGAQVYATTRHKSRFESLSGQGFRPVRFDWTDRATFENLPLDALSAGAKSAGARVLVAVSYDPHGRLSRYDSQVGGLRNLLSILPTDVRLCYISTTGVYHQKDGSWVDETSPTHPDRLGGQVHLQAESLLHACRPNSPWAVLRLAGIYGPGRVPRIADVIAGRAIASAAEGFLNLIHVQDAARAVLAVWNRMAAPSRQQATGMQSRLYAVGDDAPVVRSEFYREIARQCGVPLPSFIAPGADASPRMRSESNKRVWNRKLRRELLPALDFPDYRNGLADILRTPLECRPNDS